MVEIQDYLRGLAKHNRKCDIETDQAHSYRCAQNMNSTLCVTNTFIPLHVDVGDIRTNNIQSADTAKNQHKTRTRCQN